MFEFINTAVFNVFALGIRGAKCACAPELILNASTRIYTTMTSFEPFRTRAYSEDLRWRMVWHKEALQCSYKDIASNLGVDKSTVIRIISLFRATGTVDKRQYPKDRAARELTTPAVVCSEPRCSKTGNISA